MYAFIDETGNTGANLFDPDQPLFLTAAVITKTDFDLAYRSQYNKICRKIGVNSIHASDLGFGPLETISVDLVRLLKSADARFFISKVEKKYLLATKVFDTFFDSGENPAIPWHVYNVRPLRLILAFKVAYLIDENIARAFWAMLMEKSEAKARRLIPEICHSLLANVSRLPDPRSREIISNGLEWLIGHPQALDFYQVRKQAKNGHMPNMVAFSNLLDGLDGLSLKWRRPVKLIRHDRQSQFESTFSEWHEIVSNALPDPVILPGETRVLRKVHNSKFAILASSDSPGIQIADCILWLFKQFINGRELPYNCSLLLKNVMKRGLQNDFSFEGVGRAMSEQFGPVLDAELTEEQLQHARELQQHYEAMRLENISGYERDGLMPFERK